MKKTINIFMMSWAIILTLAALNVSPIAAQNEISCDSDYVVQADDWLSKIAEKSYGDALTYPTIAARTNAKAAGDSSYAIIEQADLIEPGWKLCLPSAEEAAEALSPVLVTALNDHLIYFHTGRGLNANPGGDSLWADQGSMMVGVGTYAIHQGSEAIVYDTFISIDQAQFVRDYLENMGITKFTVVLSHWHPDHIAGNEVYTDSEIVAHEATLSTMELLQAEIEDGTIFGPPGINPLILPTTTYVEQTTLFVGDIEVQLINFNIHAIDSTIAYLPADKIALVGDTHEDTVTFMVEYENLHMHVRELGRFKAMDVEIIYPNHGNPEVIKNGGYDTSFIDATATYVTNMIVLAHELEDEAYLSLSIEDAAGDYLNNTVSLYEAYYFAHQEFNIPAVLDYYNANPLSEDELQDLKTYYQDTFGDSQ